MSINEATKANLRRKSAFVNVVQKIHDISSGVEIISYFVPALWTVGMFSTSSRTIPTCCPR